MARHRDYTPEDDERITRLYLGGDTIFAIAELVGRTRYSVEGRLRLLGVTRPRLNKPAARSGCRWSDEETAILRANSSASIHRLLELLPGRSRGAIYEQLARLGGNVERDYCRPLHMPFETSSGVRAIRTRHGVIPYVPTIHDHLVGTV
jgi:hypothetical protein